MDAKWTTRAGAAAFALGVSMSGPQALGLAAADAGEGAAVSTPAAETGSAPSASAGPAKRGATRAARDAAGPGRSAARANPAQAAGPAAAQPRASATLDDATAPGGAGNSGNSGNSGNDANDANAADAAKPVKAAASVSAGAAPVRVVDRPVRVAAAVAVDARPAAAVAVSGDTGGAAVTNAATDSPVPAPAAASPSAAMSVAAAGFADDAGDWLSGLPSSPVAEVLSGALLLARRSLAAPGATPVGRVAAAAAVEPVSPTAADPNQHVLLIGVDGTNLSKILADPYNQAFFDLMNSGTTAAATMVGHTTISNPSWTGILTGVWSETAGVSNNVFTPWTYDTWPTLFNQLETFDPSIVTSSIGNWEVIAQIAGAGSIPADTIVYYPKINDSWLDTDDAVGVRSIEAIQNTVAGTPSFQMTYFVGVDDTGHDTGGSGTPQYAEALRNVNDNIADIMTAVDTWEAANPGEEWTVIVVTDHGQVPHALLDIGLLAHGFQSPPETTAFVIADGPDFLDGVVNNTYSQVDITPTITSLFGLTPEPYFAGKPLMERAASDFRPVVPGQAALHTVLSDSIAMYGYPDIATDLTLAVRTIAATIPYAVTTLVSSLVEALPAFLTLPVEFIGAIVYNLVNIPVQLIVRLTGVTGNSILPPQWWPFNPVPGTQPVPPTAVVPELAVAV